MKILLMSFSLFCLYVVMPAQSHQPLEIGKPAIGEYPNSTGDSLPPTTGPTHSKYSRNLQVDPFEQELIELVNQARWDNGQLPPLKAVEELCSASDGHSMAMAMNDFFSHWGHPSPCSTPSSRTAAAGYGSGSGWENAAVGYSTPAFVMNGWMNSPGHRSNILHSSHREFGVGYYLQDDDQGNIGYDLDNNCSIESTNHGPFYHYWTQNFGNRPGVYPVVIEREAAETESETVNLYVYGPGSATSMRFSNDGINWSDWEPYSENATWTLNNFSGTKTVYSEVSTGPDGSGTVYSASDMIYFNDPTPCDPMIFSNETITGPVTYTNCEIIADPNVDIIGNVTFEASSVYLGPDVEIPLGSIFIIEMQ